MYEDLGKAEPRLSLPHRASRAVLAMDALLTPQRLRVYPVVLLATWLLSYVLVAIMDPQWTPLPDFVARWTAGHILLEGDVSRLYDPGYQGELQRTLGSDRLSWFVSPPFVAVLFAPLAAMPYPAACLTWFLLSLGGLTWAAWRLKPLAPRCLAERSAQVMLIMAASAPVLELLGSGQDTVVVLVAVCAGMRLLHDDHDAVAGAVLGIGVIKPHLIFLVPVLLVLLRRWRTLAIFGSTASLAAVLSWLLVGTTGITTWLSIPFSNLYSTEVTAGQAWKSTSLTSALRGLLPASVEWWRVAVLLLAVVMVVVGVVAMRHSVRAGWCSRAWAVLLLTTALGSPHFLLYDAVLCFPVLLALAGALWDATTRVLLAAIFVLAWLAAPLHAALIDAAWPTTVLGSPWIVVGLVILWLRLIRRAPAVTVGSVG